MPPLVHDPVDKKACQGAGRQILGESGGLPNLPGCQTVRRLLQYGHNDATALGHRTARGGTIGMKRIEWPVLTPQHRHALFSKDLKTGPGAGLDAAPTRVHVAGGLDFPQPSSWTRISKNCAVSSEGRRHR